jgi:hypothetical protein
VTEPEPAVFLIGACSIANDLSGEFEPAEESEKCGPTDKMNFRVVSKSETIKPPGGEFWNDNALIVLVKLCYGNCE